MPRMLAFDASEISVVVARRLRGSDPVLMPPPPQHEGQKGYLGESRGTFGPGCALRRYRERRSSKRTLCRPCRHPGFREKPQRENRSRLSSEGRIARDRRSELSPVLQPGPHGGPPGTLHVSRLSSLLSKRLFQNLSWIRPAAKPVDLRRSSSTIPSVCIASSSLLDHGLLARPRSDGQVLKQPLSQSPSPSSSSGRSTVAHRSAPGVGRRHESHRCSSSPTATRRCTRTGLAARDTQLHRASER